MKKLTSIVGSLLLGLSFVVHGQLYTTIEVLGELRTIEVAQELQWPDEIDNVSNSEFRPTLEDGDPRLELFYVSGSYLESFANRSSDRSIEGFLNYNETYALQYREYYDSNGNRVRTIFHGGLDLVRIDGNHATGTEPCYAVGNGIVVVNELIDDNSEYGLVILSVLTDGTLLYSHYWHLNKASPLEVGSLVKRGQQVGVIGAWHGVWHLHVHFRVDPNGTTLHGGIAGNPYTPSSGGGLVDIEEIAGVMIDPAVKISQLGGLNHNEDRNPVVVEPLSIGNNSFRLDGNVPLRNFMIERTSETQTLLKTGYTLAEAVNEGLIVPSIKRTGRKTGRVNLAQIADKYLHEVFDDNDRIEFEAKVAGLKVHYTVPSNIDPMKSAQMALLNTAHQYNEANDSDETTHTDPRTLKLVSQNEDDENYDAELLESFSDEYGQDLFAEPMYLFEAKLSDGVYGDKKFAGKDFAITATVQIYVNVRNPLFVHVRLIDLDDEQLELARVNSTELTMLTDPSDYTKVTDRSVTYFSVEVTETTKLDISNDYLSEVAFEVIDIESETSAGRRDELTYSFAPGRKYLVVAYNRDVLGSRVKVRIEESSSSLFGLLQDVTATGLAWAGSILSPNEAVAEEGYVPIRLNDDASRIILTPSALVERFTLYNDRLRDVYLIVNSDGKEDLYVSIKGANLPEKYTDRMKASDFYMKVLSLPVGTYEIYVESKDTANDVDIALRFTTSEEEYLERKAEIEAGDSGDGADGLVLFDGNDIVGSKTLGPSEILKLPFRLQGTDREFINVLTTGASERMYASVFKNGVSENFSSKASSETDVYLKTSSSQLVDRDYRVQIQNKGSVATTFTYRISTEEPHESDKPLDFPSDATKVILTGSNQFEDSVVLQPFRSGQDYQEYAVVLLQPGPLFVWTSYRETYCGLTLKSDRVELDPLWTSTNGFEDDVYLVYPTWIPEGFLYTVRVTNKDRFLQTSLRVHFNTWGIDSSEFSGNQVSNQTKWVDDGHTRTVTLTDVKPGETRKLEFWLGVYEVPHVWTVDANVKFGAWIKDVRKVILDSKTGEHKDVHVHASSRQSPGWFTVYVKNKGSSTEKSMKVRMATSGPPTSELPDEKPASSPEVSDKDRYPNLVAGRTTQLEPSISPGKTYSKTLYADDCDVISFVLVSDELIDHYISISDEYGNKLAVDNFSLRQVASGTAFYLEFLGSTSRLRSGKLYVKVKNQSGSRTSHPVMSINCR